MSKLEIWNLWVFGGLLAANAVLSVRAAYWRRRLHRAVKAAQVTLERSLGVSDE